MLYISSSARSSHAGFSTILAILLTGFLIILSSGALFLFLSEWKLNRTLFSLTAAYHAAEGSMEYALIKLKHHREGFSDEVSFTSNDGGLLHASFRPPEIRYSIRSNVTGSPSSYSGSIEKQWFEIIPLFFEQGRLLSDDTKDPNPPSNGPFHMYRQSENIRLIVSGIVENSLVWNVVANDVNGNTFGLAGVVSGTVLTRDSNTNGSIKTHDSRVLSASRETLGHFLDPARIPRLTEPYLILFNTSSSDPVSYTIDADIGFSLPTTRIISSGKIGNITSNLLLSENKSRLFETLKYSIFIPE